MTTRADIIAICMTQAALCRLVPWGTQDLGRLPRSTIGRAQSLVTKLAESKADSSTASATLWNELFSEFRPANWRTHPTAPGAFPINAVSRGTENNTGV